MPSLVRQAEWAIAALLGLYLAFLGLSSNASFQRQ